MVSLAAKCTGLGSTPSSDSSSDRRVTVLPLACDPHGHPHHLPRPPRPSRSPTRPPMRAARCLPPSPPPPLAPRSSTCPLSSPPPIADNAGGPEARSGTGTASTGRRVAFTPFPRRHAPRRAADRVRRRRRHPVAAVSPASARPPRAAVRMDPSFAAAAVVLPTVRWRI